MTTLQSALECAKRGWRVFPVVPKRKSPLVKDWQSRATTDPKTIKRWWDKFPDANLGVLTGRSSGIIVLDVDPRNGGIQSWKDLESQVGQVDTFKVKTGAHGTHNYFTDLGGEELRSTSNLLPGIDLKTAGGFVVGPGSVHENGQPYQLILPVVDPAPMSDELLQLVRKARS